jgi:hypothetical protein
MLVLKDGISQWNNWDKVCTILAVVGIFFWQVFNYMPLEISSLHIRGVDIGMFFAQLSGLREGAAGRRVARPRDEVEEGVVDFAIVSAVLAVIILLMVATHKGES